MKVRASAFVEFPEVFNDIVYGEAMTTHVEDPAEGW